MGNYEPGQPRVDVYVRLHNQYSSPILLEDPPQVCVHLISSSFIPSYLFINYPSLSMRVLLSLSEWSSCNCFSLEQLEAAQRNRIETTFAFKMSWDGEEGGSTALLPYTEQLHLHSPSLPPSFSHLLSPTLHPSLHLIYSHHPLLFSAWLPLHCLSREFQGRRELAHQSRVLYT